MLCCCALCLHYIPLRQFVNTFLSPLPTFFIDLTFFRCYSIFRKLDMEV
nr:MAG TPA: hypothetical protein [Caudoviricetes sp.]DAZ74129.1 MAG TPA: hypothetical protein [Caudoviricetes sp.]